MDIDEVSGRSLQVTSDSYHQDYADVMPVKKSVKLTKALALKKPKVMDSKGGERGGSKIANAHVRKVRPLFVTINQDERQLTIYIRNNPLNTH